MILNLKSESAREYGGMRQVRTLIPTDFWFRTSLVIIIAILLFIWLAYYHSEAFRDKEALRIWGISSIAFFAVSGLDLYLRRGYQISFDDQTICWRRVGLRRDPASMIVMPFSEIIGVSSEPGTLGSRPFEAVVLRAGGQGIPDVILSRMYLGDTDIKEILANVHRRSSILFDDEVQNFYQIY